MSVYVFTGPTLSPESGRAVLDAVYLPPVAQGDVYRISLKSPRAIGIIDGFFERVPAVWHKEILWAMSQGIHVFGSASMGALRAAELAPFGMEGVGAIFESYHDGALEGDDEVAVAHGDAETGYTAASEAMVNIRASLAKAVEQGVIPTDTQALLLSIAKGLFYPDRTYPSILRLALDQGAPEAEVEALRAWLPAGRINQKQEDALAMLRLMRERLDAGLEPKHVDFHFEETQVWDRARALAGEQLLDPPLREQQFPRPLLQGEPSQLLPLLQGEPSQLLPLPQGDQQFSPPLPQGEGRGEGSRAEAVLFDQLADELRLDGDAYLRAYREAMLRVLALDEAKRRGIVVTPEDTDAITAPFRESRGLSTEPQLEAWLREQKLDHAGFERLMREQATLQRLEGRLYNQTLHALRDQLRLTGEYTRRAARASDKESKLRSLGLNEPVLTDAGITEEQLLRWYWQERLGIDPPANPAAYARRTGFESEDAFMRAILREYCYTADHQRMASG